MTYWNNKDSPQDSTKSNKYGFGIQTLGNTKCWQNEQNGLPNIELLIFDFLLNKRSVSN